MKLTLILILAASFCAFAQESGNVMFQSAGPAGAMAWGFEKGPTAAVKGAPYSATMNNESVQTLADGNRIVQTSTGTVLRDSQGRTRQDASLPAIGNLSAASAPHLVFIQDPVAGTSYTLNLTDKTAWKNPMPPPGKGGPGASVGSGATFFIHTEGGMPPLPPPPPMIAQTKHLATDEQLEADTESLGSQTMEGVAVTGVRTTRTIPAGQAGNDRPINIVTEVWTSTDLRTIVSSKRNDPRMGEQTFRLTNIVRAEPDPSLFAVPSDFKFIDGGPKTIIYRRNQ
ncbi:MAG TPA: hypothetical protein VKD23_11230 [Terriglobales bacterium]|nr:hypothetical protein [Terriglobales bacterium]